MMDNKRQNSSTALALATSGIFSLILFSILMLARVVEHHEVLDLLSLLAGAGAAFCYGKFLWFRRSSWLILAFLLLAVCLFFFIQYLF